MSCCPEGEENCTPLESVVAIDDRGQMVLPKGVETVRDLLINMSGQMNYSFIDPGTGDLEEDLEIIVNNKEVWFYPSALDAPLKEGDLVEIYLLPLGGG